MRILIEKLLHYEQKLQREFEQNLNHGHQSYYSNSDFGSQLSYKSSILTGSICSLSSIENPNSKSFVNLPNIVRIREIDGGIEFDDDYEVGQHDSHIKKFRFFKP